MAAMIRHLTYTSLCNVGIRSISLSPIRRWMTSASDDRNLEKRAPSLRRALLYLPVNDMRKVEKAAGLDVDCVCLDLEDAVALNKKAEARESLINVLKEVKFGDKDLAVRINPPQTEMAIADIDAIFKLSPVQPKTIVVPKVNSGTDIEWLFDQVYESIGTGRDQAKNIDILAQIESPIAVLNLRAICELVDNSAADDIVGLNLAGLIFGSDDYCAAVGATRTPSGTELLYARQAVVTHAKAYGIQAIDLVNINFHDYDALMAESIAGAQMGYTGKQIIHPNQIQVVQEAFSPSEERIQYAVDLERAFMEHQAAGKGAFTFRDQMIDMPTMLQCKNVLAMARKIGKLPLSESKNEEPQPTEKNDQETKE